MLLAIDIGNTTISLAVMRGQRVSEVCVIDSHLAFARLQSQLKQIFGRFRKKYPSLNESIVCSVVPRLSKQILLILEKTAQFKVCLVGRDIHVPLRNKYQNPRQVGQDRLVGAYAAKCLYGTPAIIIDFGTAITFDVVSAQGAYEGGMIIPGIRLSAESLFQKTALLPEIHNVRVPASCIGKNTNDSILSGLFYGYGTMSAGLIQLISKKISGKSKVIVTGGHTDLMKKFIAPQITKIDKHLVFKGLALLHDHLVGV